MRWNLERKDGQAVNLRLDGPLTVEHAGELRAALFETLSAANSISVELADGIEADLTCLQLLCAAHRQALAGRKNLVFKKKIPEKFIRLVEAAGFLRHQGCTLNPYHDCLWVGGNL